MKCHLSTLVFFLGGGGGGIKMSFLELKMICNFRRKEKSFLKFKSLAKESEPINICWFTEMSL